MTTTNDSVSDQHQTATGREPTDNMVDGGLVDGGQRQLGSSSVGAIAFGLWRFTDDDLDSARSLLELALESGMNLIDTADVYGLDHGGHGFGDVEERLGKVLKRTPGLRDSMVLATKGGIRPPVPYDSSRNGLTAACDASLRRLGVDHIDLYQVHRPDLYTHPAELAATLDALVESGKVGAVGVSNFTVDQTRALSRYLKTPLASTQPEFSAAYLGPLRDGTLDLAMEFGITPIAWSPVGGGSLATGDGQRPELMSVIDRLAERESVDRSAIALAFVLAHPSRPIAIIGTQNPDRLRSSVAACSVHLDRRDVYAIIEASEGQPLP